MSNGKSLGLRGRHTFKFTPEVLAKVRECARLQMHEKDIAVMVGLSPTTFSKKKNILDQLRQEIEAGRLEGIQQVSNALFDNAIGPKALDKNGNQVQLAGDVRAEMFFLERKAGWKQQVDIDATITIAPLFREDYSKKVNAFLDENQDA